MKRDALRTIAVATACGAVMSLATACPEQVCEPDSKQPCDCVDNQPGYKHCNGSGWAWGPCICEGADASTRPDSGGAVDAYTIADIARADNATGRDSASRDASADAGRADTSAGNEAGTADALGGDSVGSDAVAVDGAGVDAGQADGSLPPQDAAGLDQSQPPTDAAPRDTATPPGDASRPDGFIPPADAAGDSARPVDAAPPADAAGNDASTPTDAARPDSSTPPADAALPDTSQGWDPSLYGVACKDAESCGTAGFCYDIFIGQKTPTCFKVCRSIFDCGDFPYPGSDVQCVQLDIDGPKLCVQLSDQNGPCGNPLNAACSDRNYRICAMQEGEIGNCVRACAPAAPYDPLACHVPGVSSSLCGCVPEQACSVDLITLETSTAGVQAGICATPTFTGTWCGYSEGHDVVPCTGGAVCEGYTPEEGAGACGEAPDAGYDAAVPDAAQPDAALPDTSAPDLALPDQGLPDLGGIDLGLVEYQGEPEPGVVCGANTCLPGTLCCAGPGGSSCAGPTGCGPFTVPVICDGREDCGTAQQCCGNDQVFPPSVQCVPEGGCAYKTFCVDATECGPTEHCCSATMFMSFGLDIGWCQPNPC